MTLLQGTSHQTCAWLGLSVSVALLVGCSVGTDSAIGADSEDSAEIVVRLADADLPVYLSSEPGAIDDGWSQQSDPTEVMLQSEPTGVHAGTVVLAEPGFARVRVGRERVPIFVTPGSRIEIDVELGGTAGGFGVQFEGDHVEENQFLRDQAASLAATERELEGQIYPMFSSAYEGFREKLKTLTAPQSEVVERFLESRPGIDQRFARRARAEINYWSRLVQLMYPSLHPQMTGQPAPVGQGYYQEVGSDSLADPTLLDSPSFIRFLDEYVSRLMAAEAGVESMDLPREKLLSRYRTIRSLDADASIETYLLDQMFRGFRTSYGPRDWGRVLDELAAATPNYPSLPRLRADLEADSAERKRPTEIRTYRRIDGLLLEAHIFLPEGHSPEDERPAYLSFHGGGWAIGTPEWGYAACERMVRQGRVAISFEYRIADVHGTGIFAALDDVKYAVRWARGLEEAGDPRLGIDPEKVIGAGFSAGAHLIGAAAMVRLPGESAPADSVPNALILHSSSYNLTKSDFFAAMTDGRSEDVSLQHQVRGGLVPTILFHGSEDHLAPLPEFRAFEARMKELGNDFEAHVFDEVGHFFRVPSARTEVEKLTEAFLEAKGLSYE